MKRMVARIGDRRNALIRRGMKAFESQVVLMRSSITVRSALLRTTATGKTARNGGSGTGNLSCGVSCGWELNIQVAASAQIFNLVDVAPENPNNYIAGTAIHFVN